MQRQVFVRSLVGVACLAAGCVKYPSRSGDTDEVSVRNAETGTDHSSDTVPKQPTDNKVGTESWRPLDGVASNGTDTSLNLDTESMANRSSDTNSFTAVGTDATDPNTDIPTERGKGTMWSVSVGRRR